MKCIGSLNDIIQVLDLQVEMVTVPEWDAAVYVRGITAAERDRYESGSYTVAGKVDLSSARSRLCAMAICDEKGNRLLTDADASALAIKSGAAMDRIFAVAQRLGGVGAEAVEKAEKNSAAGPAGSSPSA